MKRKTLKRICLILIAALTVIFIASALIPSLLGQNTVSADTIYDQMPLQDDSVPWYAFIRQFAQNLFFAIISSIILVLNSVFLGFLALTEMLFKLVTDANFISISFTGPDNPFVYPNWLIIRDLANIGIVIGVIYSGLRMTLGMGNFDSKRTLVRLIGLAFLINFTPALLGLIIDGSQIATNYFFQMSGGTTSAAMGGQVIDSFGNILNPGENHLVSLIQNLSLGFVAIFLGFLYLILSATFLIRYVILWILVIISPVAFLAYAFKGGEKYWQKWWSNFISWTFVGIPIAFFIFLAAQFQKSGEPIWSESANRIGEQLSAPGVTQGSEGSISVQAFEPLIPAILIYIGYIVSLSLAPSFTKTVSGYVGKGYKSAGRWATKEARYRSAQVKDRAVQKARSDSLYDTAGRLKISTDGWNDPKKSHAVRAQVAKSIIEKDEADNKAKAQASRYLSTEKQISERQFEHSQFGQKIQKSDITELETMLYEPTPRFAPKVGGMAPARRRAMIIQQMMNKDENKARKILKNFSPNEQENEQMIAVFADMGSNYENAAKQYILSQVGRHGQSIKDREASLGFPRGFLEKVIKQASEKDAELIAHIYQQASNAKDKENQEIILNNLIEAHPKTILAVLRRLKIEEKRPMAQKMMKAAEILGMQKEFSTTRKILEHQWYIEEYSREEEVLVQKEKEERLRKQKEVEDQHNIDWYFENPADKNNRLSSTPSSGGGGGEKRETKNPSPLRTRQGGSGKTTTKPSQDPSTTTSEESIGIKKVKERIQQTVKEEQKKKSQEEAQEVQDLIQEMTEITQEIEKIDDETEKRDLFVKKLWPEFKHLSQADREKVMAEIGSAEWTKNEIDKSEWQELKNDLIEQASEIKELSGQPERKAMLDTLTQDFWRRYSRLDKEKQEQVRNEIRKNLYG